MRSSFAAGGACQLPQVLQHFHFARHFQKNLNNIYFSTLKQYFARLSHLLSLLARLLLLLLFCVLFAVVVAFCISAFVCGGKVSFFGIIFHLLNCS